MIAPYSYYLCLVYISNDMKDYLQVREMAINAGIPDNKIAIGLWAKEKGYIIKQIRLNGTRVYRYFKEN